ncbi:DHA2 family efflux MFS transporter permease subunit [Paenibacillus thalictri]|uniref:DHA2 family efflux MFS transporter permease subunit n=1 Tax=Paenibacillus thalictri TaxID=2527873 RepID=A0A4Q9DMP2_9BACL|nr:DHA2 family efflux MFS transporter permease subunit [Paenibacillus thalictri]TBL74693.1 DHA2 family efflux MFS transporter permease subunit [Paenibacillus thalictri]
MVALCTAGFIGLFSETALNIALSDLMKTFELSAATAQWLTTGYLLTLGILVPVSGLLLQWFTTRQLFISALAFAIAGTLLGALSFSFELLMVSRVLQAIGTGLLLPLMFNTILIIFPPHKRGAAMGIVGLVIMFAPAAGPMLAGLMIEFLSWHYIFWFSLPLLILSLFCGIRYMQNVSAITKPGIDLLSIALSTAGFGGIVFGFSHAGESGGWSSMLVIVSIAVGAVSLVLFCLRQNVMKQPMLNLRVFQYPMFTVGLVMVFLCFMVILSSMLVLPLFLQNAMAMSAMTAGLVLLPGGVLNGILSPIVGVLFDKFGPRWLVIPGLALIAVVLWFFSGVTVASSVGLIIVLHCCLMLGISFVMMPSQTNGLNQLPKQLYPDGTAIMNTLQQIAGAIGTAVSVSVLSKGVDSYMSRSAAPTNPHEAAIAFSNGSQNAFVFAMLVAVIGFAIALFIRRVKVAKGAEAARSMH